MASKKKFEGLEVVSSAPRMSAMEQYLYDRKQMTPEQRFKETMDTALGFTGAGITGVAPKAAKAAQYVADYKNLPEHADELFKFRTGKGSVYQHRKGNVTVRDKNGRFDHPGEHGVQPPSDKTVYMEPRATDAVGSWLQDPNIPTRMIPELDEVGKPTGKVVVQMMDDFNHRTLGSLKKGQIVSRVPYELNPRVGLNPVEIYGHAESPIGSKARNVHFGNEITEVIPGSTTMPNNYRAGGRVRMI